MERRTETGLLFFGAGMLLIAVWLLCFFRLHEPVLSALVYAGWAALAAGLILVFLAIRTLRTQGKVQAGRDFAHTTALVTHGIYGVVRHPLYLGWALMFVAAMLFSQHWLIVILGAVGIGCLYGIARLEDRELTQRFGGAYEQYRREVPAMNPLQGIRRMLAKARST